MNPNRSLVRDSIIGRNIHGNQIFMSKENSDVYTLNETASLIFDCLNASLSFEETVSRVKAEFAIDDDAVIREDICCLIDLLVDNKILRPEAVSHFTRK